jgi:hypothetical protein
MGGDWPEQAQRDYELMGLVQSAVVCCTGLNPEGQLGWRETARTTAACHGWERWVELGMARCLSGREIGRSVAGCRLSDVEVHSLSNLLAGCWER